MGLAPKDLETGLLVLEVVHSADTEITPNNKKKKIVYHFHNKIRNGVIVRFTMKWDEIFLRIMNIILG